MMVRAETVSKHISRKEREKLERQREILVAARELFARNGFHDTTLDDIARHAEFGKGTIYNYFSSKEDLFITIIDQVLEGIHAIAKSAVAGTEGGAEEKLAAYARDLVAYCREHADLMQVIGREVPRLGSPELRARIRGIRRRHDQLLKTLVRPLEDDMRAGRLRRLDAQQVAFIFEATLRMFLLHRMSEDGSFDSTDVDEGISLIITLFFSGLATP